VVDQPDFAYSLAIHRWPGLHTLSGRLSETLVPDSLRHLTIPGASQDMIIFDATRLTFTPMLQSCAKYTWQRATWLNFGTACAFPAAPTAYLSSGTT
jgi:hypothetical protein